MSQLCSTSRARLPPRPSICAKSTSPPFLKRFVLRNARKAVHAAGSLGCAERSLQEPRLPRPCNPAWWVMGRVRFPPQRKMLIVSPTPQWVQACMSATACHVMHLEERREPSPASSSSSAASPVRQALPDTSSRDAVCTVDPQYRGANIAYIKHRHRNGKAGFQCDLRCCRSWPHMQPACVPLQCVHLRRVRADGSALGARDPCRRRRLCVTWQQHSEAQGIATL